MINIAKIYTWITVACMLIATTYCIIVGTFAIAFVWFLGSCLLAFSAALIKRIGERYAE